MSNLHTKTANQIAEIFNDFVKDCAAHGEDIIYTEVKTTAGTWDHVKEQMVGGTTTKVDTMYTRSGLIAPTKLSEDSTTGKGIGYAYGVEVTDIIIGSTLIMRVKTAVPITQSGTYRIQGTTYKVDKLLESYAIGRKKCWNLVKFVRT